MQNSQIIKKRLNDLKKLSQNLKQSTQIKNDLDINLIKAIFDITKNTSSSNHEMSISYSESKKYLLENQELQDGNSRKQKRMEKVQSKELFNKFLGKSQLMPQNMLIGQNSSVHSVQSVNYQQQQQNMDKLFPDEDFIGSMSKSTSKSKLKFSKKPSKVLQIPLDQQVAIQKSNEEQIIFLREQNIRLEKQVKELKNVMESVYGQNGHNGYGHEHNGEKQINGNREDRRKNRKGSLANGRGSNGNGNFDQFGEEQYEEDQNCPFFRIKQEVDAFVTKLSISRQDFPKIQYTQKWLKLTLDKLLIKSPQIPKIPSTASNRHLKPSSSSPSSPSKTQNITSLNLQNLRQVKYIENNILFLTFVGKQEEIVEKDYDGDGQRQGQCQRQKIYVYLKFDDGESFHRWDLSIYANFCIIDNLGAERVFEKNKFNQKFKKPKVQEEKINGGKQIKEVEEDFQKLQDRDLLMRYLQNKQKFIQSQKKLRTVMLKKMSIKRKSTLQSQNLSNSEQLINSQLKKFSKTNKIFENNSIQKLSKEHYEQEQEQEQDRRRELEKQAKMRAQQKQKQEKIAKQEEERRLELERLQDRMRLEQQNRQKQRIRKQQELDYIKQGIYVTKYSKSALNPHQKKLYVDKTGSKLCWTDKQKPSQQPKYINISEIESINQGEIGEGVRRHIDEKKIKNLKCFLMIKTYDKSRKTIQFSSKSLKQMEYFCQGLEGFVGRFKRQEQD